MNERLAEIMKPFPTEQYTINDCNSDDCPAYIEFLQKQVDDLSALVKEVDERAIEAETNETTFRGLLKETHDVLARLPNTTASITNLRYRILDTVNETSTVSERLEK